MQFLLGSVSLATLGATALAIWLDPELGLRVLWSGIVPVAPLIFLLAPNFWVSACPFAFLQALPRRLGPGSLSRISSRAARRLGMAGWALLFLLVPLRHVLFDKVRVAALAAIVGIAVVALVCGFLFQGLSGWCNSLCPVRPVENLYGQFSLLDMLPYHCSPCNSCTSSCARIDPRNWPKNEEASYFAYAFPGFVAAFFLVPKSSGPAELYLLHAAGVLLSIGALGACRLFLPHRSVVKLGALLAVSLYYLFAPYGIAQAWGLTPLAGLALTLLALGLIASRLGYSR